MITKNLIIFALVAAFSSDVGASENFTIQSVLCLTHPDSIVMTISGEGDPEFRTYDMNDPYRVIVEVGNGKLPPGTIKRSFTSPVSRLEIQPDYTTQPVIRIVCELVKERGFSSRKADGKITVVFESEQPKLEIESELPELPD